MKASINSIVVDNYFNLLSTLSRENKIKLMAKLSESIVKEIDEEKGVVDHFFGAFKSEKSAEDIIKEIKKSRNFEGTIEAF